jgi:hypothetical protein
MFPQQQLDNIPSDDTQQIVHSLAQLHNLGKPKTDEEVSERIDQYFLFCEQSKLRPGIEGLCLALNISRKTLFRWNEGYDCSEYRSELIQSAKSFISAFIEAALQSGKVSPPSGIFLMKNWCGYKDSISIEESVSKYSENEHTTTVSALPKLGAELPVIDTPTE